MFMEIKDMNLEQYETHYSEIAPNYPYVDDFSPYGNHWHRTNFIIQYMKPGLKVWDAGCSNGGLAKYLTENYDLKYFASDIAPFFVQNAQRSAPKSICAAFPLEKTPFADGVFDVVIAGEVLEHVLNIHVALLEIIRVLRPNGYLLATTPREPDQNKQHLRFLGESEWKELLPKAAIIDGKYSWLVAWQNA